jgi:methionyl aminopeptidase
MLTPHVQPGVSTEELDKICHDYIVNELKCTPTNVGYYGFPKTVCTSVNHVVCHGIPDVKQVLKDGDIINVDVAVTTPEGWIGDTSRMYYVGQPSNLASAWSTPPMKPWWPASAPSSPGPRWAM